MRHFVGIGLAGSMLILGIWLRFMLFQSMPFVRPQILAPDINTPLPLAQLAIRCSQHASHTTTEVDYLSCGQRAYHTADFGLAIASYTAVLQREPGNATALLGRANAYLAQHDDARAVACLDQAIALNVDYPGVYATRAFLFARMGNLHAARQAAAQVTTGRVRYFATHAVSHLLHGAMRPALADGHRAWRAYRDAVAWPEYMRTLPIPARRSR